MRTIRSHALGAIAAIGLAGAGSAGLAAGEIASPWSEGKRDSKARLVAGAVAGKVMAGVEISIADGWKTYWRMPGDAGGVPPMFKWAKSENVDSVKVLYPVPTRYSDKDGDTLGFKSYVAFPVEVTAKNPSKPIGLVLELDYGICREVCVPVDVELKVDVAPGEAAALPAGVLAAMERVPRTGAALRPGDPKLTKTEVKLDGPHPSLAIEAVFPGGTSNAAAYVESPNGYYIPLPKTGSAKPAGPDTLRFEIDLTDAVDPADIRGKDAKVTLVSDKGLTEAMFKFE